MKLLPYVLMLLVLLIAAYWTDQIDRNYSGLTEYSEPINTSIAIDMKEQYLNGYLRLLWKINKEKWNK